MMQVNEIVFRDLSSRKIFFFKYRTKKTRKKKQKRKKKEEEIKKNLKKTNYVLNRITLGDAHRKLYMSFFFR